MTTDLGPARATRKKNNTNLGNPNTSPGSWYRNVIDPKKIIWG